MNWKKGFEEFALKNGYHRTTDPEEELDMWHVEQFLSFKDRDEANAFIGVYCESEAMKYLEPLMDAQEYVNRIHEEFGYKFHIITSVSNNPVVKEYRQYNIESLFPKNAIKELSLTGRNESKADILKRYANSRYLWIEDHPANAMLGYELGLEAVLLRHSYNADFESNMITMVKNWEDIYNMVKSNV